MTKWFNGDEDLSDAFFVRRTVFVDEQKVPEDLEFEENDNIAEHIVVYDGRRPVGCGRLLITENVYKLERISVLKEERGKKYGDLIVRLLIRKAFENGATNVIIHAQVHAQKFYEKLGFSVLGDVFDEAGIEHIKMIRTEDVVGKCVG